MGKIEVHRCSDKGDSVGEGIGKGGGLDGGIGKGGGIGGDLDLIKVANSTCLLAFLDPLIGFGFSVDSSSFKPFPPTTVEKQFKEKKYKQPSSPGERHAKLLNSIFSHVDSKKKKSKSTTQSVRSSTGLQHELVDENRNIDLAWLDEKFKFYNEFLEKSKNYGCGSLEKDRTSEKILRNFVEEDDGGESESSSDLFELQNRDLGLLCR
ncbi:protein BIG GRAIN 1-like E [Telopea speciosissima]|uniref:protein BIG GRAIN 1-like E n=1 Tax=Telopea speciosissima TaxID=54955 RepID=UPI001CC78C93|nr:protein BIG GRAIN 1-like E [Telopea speciosissima]